METSTASKLGGGGSAERAVWSTAYMNDLPDSAFLYVEDGDKDSEGKTTPRSKRHFPYKDANGNVDLAHLRNALARIPQSNLSAEVKAAATKKAQGILAKQGGSQKSRDFLFPNTQASDLCGNCMHEQSAHDMDADGDYAGDTDGDGDGACCQCDCQGWVPMQNYADSLAEEYRYAVAPLTHVDVRDPTANDDGTWSMSGYAAVYNQQTTLYDGRFVRMTEDIDPMAFDRVLREQRLGEPQGVVHFNYGHDMASAVAATDVPAGQPGSLQLRSDAHGLYFMAKVSRDDPDGLRMASKMRTGVLKQASFAFTIRDRQEHISDLGDGRQQEHQRITEIGMLKDVCATPQGAYPQTISQLRTYAAAIGQPSELGGRQRQPDPGGATPVSRTHGGGEARRRALAQMMRDSAKHRKVR